MNRQHIEGDDLDALPDLPQDILADFAVGLDDLKHSRGVEGKIMLARLDAIIASAKATRPTLDRDGENRSNRSATD